MLYILDRQSKAFQEHIRHILNIRGVEVADIQFAQFFALIEHGGHICHITVAMNPSIRLLLILGQHPGDANGSTNSGSSGQNRLQQALLFHQHHGRQRGYGHIAVSGA